MQAIDFQKNFFQMFGLPERYRLDRAELSQRYRRLQNEVHPDKFADRPEAERRLSMQWTTQINEAYQTLGNAVQRGRYLLRQHGVDTQEETNTAMPVDFLMQQMEWREAIDEARNASDAVALEGLEARLQHEMRELETQLAARIDDDADYLAAAGDVRKLRFMEKLAEDIASAFDGMDT
jgi:molecular chaperone HscB